VAETNPKPNDNKGTQATQAQQQQAPPAATRPARSPDRFIVLTPDPDYSGNHPAAGVRFLSGTAFTEDPETAKRCRDLGLVVRNVKDLVHDVQTSK
jgi:hypothetical protein